MPKVTEVIESIEAKLVKASHAAVGDPKLKQLIDHARQDFRDLVKEAVDDAKEYVAEASTVILPEVEKHIAVFLDKLHPSK